MIFASLILLGALIGIMLNLATSSVLLQPDWSLALLLAALLARRLSWPWVLPAVLVHDVALYWSPLVTFPFMASIPVVLAHIDAAIGPGLPQRFGLLVATTLPLLWYGGGFIPWLMTVLITVPIWYALVHSPYVEPA
jgi:hypothetical protein